MLRTRTEAPIEIETILFEEVLLLSIGLELVVLPWKTLRKVKAIL